MSLIWRKGLKFDEVLHPKICWITPTEKKLVQIYMHTFCIISELCYYGNILHIR